MTRFDLLAARARRAVEHVYGEPVTIYPMDRPLGPNGTRARSQNRDAFERTGCFYDIVDLPPSDSGQPIIGRAERLMSRSPSLTVSIELSSEVPIRTGDLIYRAEKNAWLEITEIEPDGVGGAVLTVATAKGLSDA